MRGRGAPQGQCRDSRPDAISASPARGIRQLHRTGLAKGAHVAMWDESERGRLRCPTAGAESCPFGCPWHHRHDLSRRRCRGVRRCRCIPHFTTDTQTQSTSDLVGQPAATPHTPGQLLSQSRKPTARTSTTTLPCPIDEPHHLLIHSVGPSTSLCHSLSPSISPLCLPPSFSLQWCECVGCGGRGLMTVVLPSLLHVLVRSSGLKC